MNDWCWIAASCRGTSHEKTGIRLQDAHITGTIERSEGLRYFGIISDGAGSAAFGRQGASLVCRVLSQSIRMHFREKNDLPQKEEIESWIDITRDRIFYAATKRGLSPRDFAATLVCVISTGHESLIVHIGDGCVVLKEKLTGTWHVPSWPAQGEFASTTFFVTDESELRLVISRFAEEISAIVAFSDGIERLALDFSKRAPFEGFLDGMLKPVMTSKIAGKERELSKKLENYLNGDSVNSRTDDDKSLIIAVRK